MKRLCGLLCGLLFVTFFCAALGLAQEPPVGKPEPPAKKEAPDVKGDPDKKDGKEVDDKTKELISRIGKNMEQSGDRLGKKDPGTETRKIQDDIVKDLDALIDQNKKDQQAQQQKQQGGGASSSSANRSSPKDSEGAAASQSKTGGGQEQPGQAKNPGKEGKDGQGQAKKKEGGGKDSQPGQAREGGKQGAMQLGQAKEADGKGKGILAELYRNAWGKLPELRRQEMDAYSRERFMRKYEDLLKQYYRTISEQGNR